MCNACTDSIYYYMYVLVISAALLSSLLPAYPFPRFPPHMSPDDSDEEGSLPGDLAEPLPLPPLSPEANLTPYPDPERRANAAERRR